MAVNFPENPDIGQQFPVNNRVYVWDGSRWQGLATTNETVVISPLARSFETNDDVIGDSNQNNFDDYFPEIPEDFEAPPLTFALLNNEFESQLEPIKKDPGIGIGYYPQSNTLFAQQLAVVPDPNAPPESKYGLIIDDDDGGTPKVKFGTALNTVVTMSEDGISCTGVTTTSSIDTNLVLSYENVTFGRIPNTGENTNAGETTPRPTEFVGGYHLPPLPLAENGGFYIIVEDGFENHSKIEYDVTVIINNGTNQTMCYEEFTFINTGYNSGVPNEFVATNKNGQVLDSVTPRVSEENYIRTPDCRIEVFTRDGFPALVLFNRFAGDCIFTVNIVARKTILPTV